MSFASIDLAGKYHRAPRVRVFHRISSWMLAHPTRSEARMSNRAYVAAVGQYCHVGNERLCVE
jgi:hypothetical protein